MLELACSRHSPGLRLRTIAAMLQTSVLAPHLAPRITSGERYCRVWISFVKWWPTQQAFPRSAILTDIVSIAVFRSSSLLLFPEPVLFRDMPEMFSVKTSLTHQCLKTESDGGVDGLRGLFTLLLRILSITAIARRASFFDSKHILHG